MCSRLLGYCAVSWKWDINVTKFSVVFVYKLLYNVGKKQRENKGEKNSVKIKEKKQIQNKRKTCKAKR